MGPLCGPAAITRSPWYGNPWKMGVEEALIPGSSSKGNKGSKEMRMGWPAAPCSRTMKKKKKKTMTTTMKRMRILVMEDEEEEQATSEKHLRVAGNQSVDIVCLAAREMETNSLPPGYAVTHGRPPAEHLCLPRRAARLGWI